MSFSASSNVQETQVDVARRAVEIGKVSLTGGEVECLVGPQGQLNLLELTTPAAWAARARRLARRLRRRARLARGGAAVRPRDAAACGAPAAAPAAHRASVDGFGA